MSGLLHCRQAGGAVWTCRGCGYTYNPLEARYDRRDRCPKCGSEEIEKTRSSLLVEWLRFLREKKPRFAIYENVKNITGSRFRPTFDLFVKELDDYSYNVYWKVLNAKHYGIPQNRERVYCVIIRKDLDNGKFQFPAPIPLKRTLSDMLENEVDERYYLPDNKVAAMIPPPCGSVRPSVQAGTDPQTGIHGICSLVGVKLSKQGTQLDGCCDTALTLLARDYKGFGNQQITAVLKQKYEQKVRNKVSNALSDCHGYRVRKLTPRECWRLMGFSDEDFDKARSAMNKDLYGGKDRSGTQLYKQAGNSIVVDVLSAIMKELYGAMPYLFQDMAIGSFFSGIGAFEKALSTFDFPLNETGSAQSVSDDELHQLGYINNYNGDANRVYDGSTVARTLKAEGGGGWSQDRMVQDACLNSKVNGRRPSLSNRVYDPRGVAAAITTSNFFMPTYRVNGEQNGDSQDKASHK